MVFWLVILMLAFTAMGCVLLFLEYLYVVLGIKDDGV